MELARKDFVGYFFKHHQEIRQTPRSGFVVSEVILMAPLFRKAPLPLGLGVSAFGPANEPGFELPLSSRERRIVSTVIQWLGSSVGFDFLNLALKRAGYRIVKE